MTSLVATEGMVTGDGAADIEAATATALRSDSAAGREKLRHARDPAPARPGARLKYLFFTHPDPASFSLRSVER